MHRFPPIADCCYLYQPSHSSSTGTHGNSLTKKITLYSYKIATLRNLLLSLVGPILGNKSWVISQKDASIRSFCFLMSRKPLVWSLDDDCYPAQGPNGGLVNAISEHVFYLLTPSTPYFFDSVYDSYRPCVDFVRGYPYIACERTLKLR